MTLPDGETLYIKESGVTYGCYYSDSYDGVKTDWKMGLGLGIYCLTKYFYSAEGYLGSVFRAFNCYSSGSHIKMALDCPGAKIICTEPGGYGGTCKTVAIPINETTAQWAESIYRDYNKDAHMGQMITSTGQWVDVEDWDQIEASI